LSARIIVPGVALSVTKVELAADGARVLIYLESGGWLAFDSADEALALELSVGRARRLLEARDEAQAVREHASAVSL
jgi:hypothetical protein